MKKTLLALSTLSLASALALADAEVGKAAPDFSVKDINGKTHNLSDYKGKIVVLETYNLDCPFVANHYNSGAIQELQKENHWQGRGLAGREFQLSGRRQGQKGIRSQED